MHMCACLSLCPLTRTKPLTHSLTRPHSLTPTLTGTVGASLSKALTVAAEKGGERVRHLRERTSSFNNTLSGTGTNSSAGSPRGAAFGDASTFRHQLTWAHDRYVCLCVCVCVGLSLSLLHTHTNPLLTYSLTHSLPSTTTLLQVHARQHNLFVDTPCRSAALLARKWYVYIYICMYIYVYACHFVSF